MSQKIPFRYIAISSQEVCPEPVPERIKLLDRLGVDAVQIRDKSITDRKKSKWLDSINCKNSLLFINSRADFAKLYKMAGVHRSGQAISSRKIKMIAGKDCFIGLSTHNLTEVNNAATLGADFITFSPIFPTASKPDIKASQCHGISGLKKACRGTGLPVFALGAVTPDNIAACLKAGAYGGAGIRSLFQPRDPAGNWEKISTILYGSDQ